MRIGPGLSIAALVALCACPAPPRVLPRTSPVPLDDGSDAAGVVHVVRRGQTLYRIAITYGIDPAELMEANGIADPRSLAVGQELFVPGATRVLEVQVLDPQEAPGPLPRKPAPAEVPAPAGAPGRPGREDPPDEAPAPASLAPRRALAWPLKGVLYGRFGVRGGARHDGIDIAAPEGSPVLAADDGTVIFAGEQSGYGIVVILRHEGGLVTVYAHASAALVHEGERASRGQPVARVGQTGRTTGPHLHFEVREGVKPRNPLLFLP